MVYADFEEIIAALRAFCEFTLTVKSDLHSSILVMEFVLRSYI